MRPTVKLPWLEDGWPANTVESEILLRRAVKDQLTEIYRLRALLLTVSCPGGGWTGQPKEIVEATVADCVAAGVCGCIYGKSGGTDD